MRWTKIIKLASKEFLRNYGNSTKPVYKLTCCRGHSVDSTDLRPQRLRRKAAFSKSRLFRISTSITLIVYYWCRTLRSNPAAAYIARTSRRHRRTTRRRLPQPQVFESLYFDSRISSNVFKTFLLINDPGGAQQETDTVPSVLPTPAQSQPGHTTEKRPLWFMPQLFRSIFFSAKLYSPFFHSIFRRWRGLYSCWGR